MGKPIDIAAARDALENSKAPDAKEGLQRLHNAVTVWQEKMEEKKDATKQSTEGKNKAYAELKEACENSISPNEKKAEIVAKLRGIESAWQEYEEAVAKGKEDKNIAAGEVKAAYGSIERAVRESHHLTLPGVA